MSRAHAIRVLRRIVKKVLPYGLVMRIYGRGGEECAGWKNLLPYGLVSRFLIDVPPAWEELSARYARTAALLVEKRKRGEKIDAIFFVTNAALFPARPLYDAMLADGVFSPRIVVIPDLRWPGVNPAPAMEECFASLAKSLPEGARIEMARKEGSGVWRDVFGDGGIVCHPLPYSESYAASYAPRRAAEKQYLPICVNYGYYRSIYDRYLMALPHYAWMWKAFFECEGTLAEYRAASRTRGENAFLSGYVKMDAFRNDAAPHSRKRILVALHHSVEGGTNEDLALANFTRYAECFLALPARYPDIDFIFRPHPYLLKIMSSPMQWGRAKTEAYVASLKACKNVIWSEDGDYFRDFAASDACIQDCGSYLVEYLYTGKPCCYMLKSPEDIEAKFAPLGRKCLECCCIAYEWGAIDRFIRDVVIAGCETKKEARETLSREVMLNYPRASRVALDHIKSALGA